MTAKTDLDIQMMGAMYMTCMMQLTLQWMSAVQAHRDAVRASQPAQPQGLAGLPKSMRAHAYANGLASAPTKPTLADRTSAEVDAWGIRA